MRRPLPFLLLFVFLTLLLTTSFPFGQTAGGTSERRHSTRIELSHGQKYVPGEALVRFKPGTGRQAMFSSHGRVGATVKRDFASVEGLQVVKLAPEISVKRILRNYRQDPNVLYAEPNYIVHPTSLPNDPLFPRQWGLSNSGQDGGTSGTDIHAQQAWSVTTGSQNVVVAVIDTGID